MDKSISLEGIRCSLRPVTLAVLSSYAPWGSISLAQTTAPVTSADTQAVVQAIQDEMVWCRREIPFWMDICPELQTHDPHERRRVMQTQA